jgi:hypothetical protein
MSKNNQDENTGPKESLEQQCGKRPYKKPAFRYERVFVTSALSCGKISATQGSCMMNRKLS